MTPGPKAYTQSELETLIYTVLGKNEDNYQEKRQKIFELAFEHHDGLSSMRIDDAIKKTDLSQVLLAKI